MSKLSDEELLEIIQQKAAEPAIPENANNLTLFLSTFGLEEGTLKIPVKLVYRLYKLWSKQKMTEILFYKQMTLLMPNKGREREDDTYYLLNSSTIKITESIYRLIRPPSKQLNTGGIKKHFQTFVKSCNITKGSDWMPVSELRTVYLAWMKIKRRNCLLNPERFEAFCRLYLANKGKPLEVAVNKKVINVPKKEPYKKSPQVLKT